MFIVVVDEVVLSKRLNQQGLRAITDIEKPLEHPHLLMSDIR